MCSFCGDGWRFEATELGGPNAGQVKAVLHPIGCEFEEGYSRIGTGSVTLATRDPAPEDIWAGSTGLYISQVLPDGSRKARFGAYVEKWNGAGGGATTTAFQSIEKFLDKRIIAGPADPYALDVVFVTDPPETKVLFEISKPTSPTTNAVLYTSPQLPGGYAAVGAFLVELARGTLEGQNPPSGISSLRGSVESPHTHFPIGDPLLHIDWWDFKNIGQFIRELVEMENGAKYRLEHTYTDAAPNTPGYWSTTMIFSDEIGETRDYILLSDREGWQYGLEVDATDKATRVYGVGAGDAGYTQYSIAYDADGVDNLPEHQVSVAWKDQTNTGTLDSLSKGYVLDHRDPTTVPSMSVVGMPDYDPDDENFNPQKGFPAPEICQPGDIFGVELGYGVITVRGIQVRNLAVAWKLAEGNPVERAIAMQPVLRPNLSVRTQTPARAPAPTQPVTPDKPNTGAPVADPWPTPGKVSNMQSTGLTEVSGMEVSIKNPGYIWVHNDEQELPDQVSLVNLKTGERVGYFNPNPGVSGTPVGDPEAIRISRKTGKLVLADTGDNDLNRPTSGVNQPHLLVVDEPKGGGNKGNIAATRLPISYPDNKRWNVETLLIHPVTDEVFLVTKEATRAQVFSFGVLTAMNTTDNEGVLVATLGISMISDGVHTRNGQFALFRTAKVTTTQVYRVAPWGKVGDIATPAMAKSEAIAVEGTCSFLTTTENTKPGEKAPIYRVLIPTKFGATCTTVAGPQDNGGGSSGPNGPSVVPGQLIDMSQWKLQMPI